MTQYKELLCRVASKVANDSVTEKARSRALNAFIAHATEYMSLSDNILFDIDAFSVGISPSKLKYGL